MRKQLKRDDLTLKMRIYITGKLYETRKWIGGNAGIPAKVIAKELSEKHQKCISALSKYALFSRTADELADSYEEYIDGILSEKISASYGNIHKMISEAEKYVNKCAKNSAVSKPVPAQIKVMPAYDPDADLAGLRLTVPS